MGIQSNNETIPEFATVSTENRGCLSVLYEITDLKKRQIKQLKKIIIFSVYNRGVSVHVFITIILGTGLSVRYAYSFHQESRSDSLWCGVTDRCINVLESRFWDASDTCSINPTQALTRAAAISSGSRVWAVMCCIHAQSGRDHSFLCTTSFSANKHEWTSHASCNRSISVSTTERRQQNRAEIKCHVAFHLPQQVISVHSSLLYFYFTLPGSLNDLIYISINLWWNMLWQQVCHLIDLTNIHFIISKFKNCIMCNLHVLLIFFKLGVD